MIMIQSSLTQQYLPDNYSELGTTAWNASCQGWMAAEAALGKHYLSIFYGIEFVVGVLGNSLVVFGYLFCLKNWSSSNVYLFNLAISDFAFLCTLPLLIKNYARDAWPYGDVLCISNRFMLHANLYTSILFLTCISVDRYLLMSHPFRQHLLQRKEFAVLVSLAVWVLVTLELLPMLFFINPDPGDNSTRCRDYASSGDPRSSLVYSMCLTFSGFLVPLFVMCFFYFKIAVFLKRRVRPQAPSLPLEKPLNLVILAVVIFSVLFTPYHVLRNLRIASRLATWPPSPCSGAVIHSLYIVTRPLAFLNSVINPLFYFLAGDHFREMLTSKLRQHCQALAWCFRRCASWPGLSSRKG